MTPGRAQQRTPWRPAARTVAVVLHRRARGIAAAQVRRDASRLLRRLRTDAELCVTLVGDGEMRRLNATYRGTDRPTDVLAFAAREGKPAPMVDQLLGDVVISLDTAARQASARGVTLAAEVRLLLTHGILHLLGYDHERSPGEARRMFRKQRELIRTLDGEE